LNGGWVDPVVNTVAACRNIAHLPFDEFSTRPSGCFGKTCISTNPGDASHDEKGQYLDSRGIVFGDD
jgi:hypothetical protein